MTSENNTNKYRVLKEVSITVPVDDNPTVSAENVPIDLTEDEVRELASQLPENKDRQYIGQLADEPHPLYSNEENWADENPKTVYDLDGGDECYVLEEDGQVVKTVWHDLPAQRQQRKQGNIRLNPEPLERKAQVREAVESIRRYKLENGLMFEPDYSDESEMCYCIYYDHRNNKFDVDNNGLVYQIAMQIGYFKTREDAKEVIDNCRDSLLTVFNID